MKTALDTIFFPPFAAPLLLGALRVCSQTRTQPAERPRGWERHCAPTCQRDFGAVGSVQLRVLSFACSASAVCPVCIRAWCPRVKGAGGISVRGSGCRRGFLPHSSLHDVGRRGSGVQKLRLRPFCQSPGSGAGGSRAHAYRDAHEVRREMCTGGMRMRSEGRCGGDGDGHGRYAHKVGGEMCMGDAHPRANGPFPRCDRQGGRARALCTPDSEQGATQACCVPWGDCSASLQN